eukprot:scaffold34430_cov58-Phaeocystis_antarctica.AAC.3
MAAAAAAPAARAGAAATFDVEGAGVVQEAAWRIVRACVRCVVTRALVGQAKRLGGGLALAHGRDEAAAAGAALDHVVGRGELADARVGRGARASAAATKDVEVASAAATKDVKRHGCGLALALARDEGSAAAGAVLDHVVAPGPGHLGALATCIGRAGTDGGHSVIVFSRLGGDDELADDKSAQDRAGAVRRGAPLVLLVLGQHCPPLDSTPRSSSRREEVHVHLVDEVRPDDAKVVVVAACIAADAERGDEHATLLAGTVLVVVRGDRLRPALGTLLLEHEERRGHRLLHVEGFKDAGAVVQHGRSLNPVKPVPRGGIEVVLAVVPMDRS